MSAKNLATEGIKARLRGRIRAS